MSGIMRSSLLFLSHPPSLPLLPHPILLSWLPFLTHSLPSLPTLYCLPSFHLISPETAGAAPASSYVHTATVPGASSTDTSSTGQPTRTTVLSSCLAKESLDVISLTEWKMPWSRCGTEICTAILPNCMRFCNVIKWYCINCKVQ